MTEEKKKSTPKEETSAPKKDSPATEVKPEKKADTSSEVKSEKETAAEPEPKPEVKSEEKPAQEPEVKPGTESEERPKPEAETATQEAPPVKATQKRKKKINKMSLKEIEAKLKLVKEKMGSLQSYYAKQLLKQKEILLKEPDTTAGVESRDA